MENISDYMANKRDRKCLTCGKPFLAEHLSRRYCTAACRIEYNNFNAQGKRLLKKPVSDVLERNVKILMQYKNGETVLCSELQAQGYNFEIHTFIKKDEQGADYAFCYNSGLAFIDNQKTKVEVKHLKFQEAEHLYFNNHKKQ